MSVVSPPCVLLVGPDTASWRALTSALAARGVEAVRAEDPMVAAGQVDLVLATAGEVALAICRGRCAPVAIVGGAPQLAPALEALRAGAFDYLAGEPSIEAVMAALERARARSAGAPSGARARLDRLIGASPPMQALYALVERAAETSAAVLITGERGTGKRLLARVLHRLGRTPDGPVIDLDCAALPEPLLATELLGNPGDADHPGRLARARGGTLILSEVDALPPPIQLRLVRALDQVRDIRVVAATHRNLEAAVADEQFREDLFYRLAVVQLALPPLRERAGDVLMLAEHFVGAHAALHDWPVTDIARDAADRLLAYHWPGNVRELANTIERAVAFSRGPEIELGDLPEKLRSFRRSHVLVVSNAPSELLSMDEVERRYVLRVLHAVGGNKKEAARVLGFDRKTLYRKLERYGLADRGKEPG